MYHVKEIWTNGLWGTSKDTDVYSETMRFILAPDVVRISIQLTLWMGMRPEWMKQMFVSNCLIVSGMVKVLRCHWECESQELHGRFKVMESNTTCTVFVSHLLGFSLYLDHSTAESCVDHCLHFWPKYCITAHLHDAFIQRLPQDHVCMHF